MICLIVHVPCVLPSAICAPVRRMRLRIIDKGAALAGLIGKTARSAFLSDGFPHRTHRIRVRKLGAIGAPALMDLDHPLLAHARHEAVDGLLATPELGGDGGFCDRLFLALAQVLEDGAGGGREPEFPVQASCGR